MAYINRAHARAAGSRDTQFTVFLNGHSSWLYSRYEEKNSIVGRTIYRHLRDYMAKFENLLNISVQKTFFQRHILASTN